VNIPCKFHPDSLNHSWDICGNKIYPDE